MCTSIYELFLKASELQLKFLHTEWIVILRTTLSVKDLKRQEMRFRMFYIQILRELGFTLE